MTELLLRLQDVNRQRTQPKSNSRMMTPANLPVIPSAVSEADVTELEDNSLTYVAGYVCKIVLKDHDCDCCNDMLLSTYNSKEELRVFFQFKVYKHCTADSLYSPS